MNLKKKGHKPIIYNINDDVIKSFSEINVNLLINNIVEGLKIYPRTELFINSNNSLYSDNGLKTILKDITKDKNIGVNSLRSAYEFTILINRYISKISKIYLKI